MFYLTETQTQAIEWLAKYKYLTSSQFVKMGLYKRRGYLTNALKPLVDMKKPLIDKDDFNPLNGKLESFYYLTKYGKNFLIDELDYVETQIKVPRGMRRIYLKDYHHRKSTIDFHIQLQRWLESNDGRMDLFNYYFDKSGNNRSKDKREHVKALNRVQLDKVNSFIPDANTILSFGGKKYLYLFEQHNGNDAKRLYEQLYIHIFAISNGVVLKKYNLKRAHKVVVVCEQQSVKDSVLQRLQKTDGIEHYNDFFLFKTNKELEDNFSADWTLINGGKADFLPTHSLTSS